MRTPVIFSRHGSPMIALENNDITDGPEAAYAVSTPEHYLPLVYCLGAANGEKVQIFNNVCDLGSMAMTGFIWD